MKFTPKQLDGNVNVSKTHPLIELLWMVGGLIFLVGVTFVLLGISADWAASKTPVKVENWLGNLALAEFPAEESPALKARLEALLKQVPDDSPLHRYNFTIYLSDSDDVNAIALPGGRIVVFKGLLDQVESEMNWPWSWPMSLATLPTATICADWGEDWDWPSQQRYSLEKIIQPAV